METSLLVKLSLLGADHWNANIGLECCDLAIIKRYTGALGPLD